MTKLTNETYYQDTDYLSNSTLSNFVSFDVYWNATYNIQQFLNPTQPESSAITIGSLVDRMLTEWFILDSEYWPTLDKAWMMAELDMMGIEYKKADTNPVLRSLLEQNGYVFKKELDKTERTAIETIIRRSNNFQYDETTTLLEYIKECDSQHISVSEEWGMRWKFDFLNTKRKLISDLKTTWNLDRMMKEVTFQWKPNIYHKNIRQMAIYQELHFLDTWEKFQCELIYIDYKGKHRILRIGQRALDKALEQVRKDIEVLRKIYAWERSFIEAIDIDDTPITHTTPVMESIDEEEPDFLTSF